MSYTIGYRMPMRDRLRVRVRLVIDDEGYTEATRRALERIAGLPDGTVVEALQVFPAEDSGRGGETRSEPSETPVIAVVWNRSMCMAISAGSLPPAPVSPPDMAYPSEDGAMSFELPSNDALNVLVTADDEDTGWMQDEAIASLPDGSVAEVLWQMVDGTVEKEAYLMYGRELALLVGPGESGGSGGGDAS